MRGTPEQPLATVIVPPDVRPGQSFPVQTPNLGVVWLAVPPGVGPGSVLIESFKGQWEQSFRAQAAGAARAANKAGRRCLVGAASAGLAGIVCCIMIVFVVGSWFGSGPFYGCNELSLNSTDVSGADGGEQGVACCPSDEVSENFGWQTGEECDSDEWCDWSGSGCFDCCSAGRCNDYGGDDCSCCDVFASCGPWPLCQYEGPMAMGRPFVHGGRALLSAAVDGTHSDWWTPGSEL